MSEEITTKDVKEWMQELAKAGIKPRVQTFDLPQGHIGGGVYRISDQCLTDKVGWDMFQEALLKRGNEILKQLK